MLQYWQYCVTILAVLCYNIGSIVLQYWQYCVVILAVLCYNIGSIVLKYTCIPYIVTNIVYTQKCTGYIESA